MFEAFIILTSVGGASFALARRAVQQHRAMPEPDRPRANRTQTRPSEWAMFATNPPASGVSRGVIIICLACVLGPAVGLFCVCALSTEIMDTISLDVMPGLKRLRSLGKAQSSRRASGTWLDRWLDRLERIQWFVPPSYREEYIGGLVEEVGKLRETGLSDGRIAVRLASQQLVSMLLFCLRQLFKVAVLSPLAAFWKRVIE